jgi:hypothetical protein
MCIKPETKVDELSFVSAPLIPKLATYLNLGLPQQCLPNLETLKARKEFVPESEDLEVSQVGSSKVEAQPVYQLSAQTFCVLSLPMYGMIDPHQKCVPGTKIKRTLKATAMAANTKKAIVARVLRSFPIKGSRTRDQFMKVYSLKPMKAIIRSSLYW